jgi:hypothetical protein
LQKYPSDTHIKTNTELLHWNRLEALDLNSSFSQSRLGVRGDQTTNEIGTRGEF